MKFEKKLAKEKRKWTLEDIKNAIEHYKSINSKYPSTIDFDKTDFLPTSRLIQRNFGGIVKLREVLGLDTPKDYTKGSRRSVVAKGMYARSVEFEEQFYKYLISKIPEVRVHEHKILRPGHVCCDFFVYNKLGTSGVAIDIFYAQDIFSLIRIINIKEKRYVNLPFSVYFVLIGNNLITQADIDLRMSNKKNQLLRNVMVVNESLFKDKIITNLI